MPASPNALHTALTGERQGYYSDFGSLGTLATTLTQAFFHARERTVRAFAGIARQYGVSYWDYSADPICGEKAYFYNSQHLNHKGAAAFSSICLNSSKRHKSRC